MVTVHKSGLYDTLIPASGLNGQASKQCYSTTSTIFTFDQRELSPVLCRVEEFPHESESPVPRQQL